MLKGDGSWRPLRWNGYLMIGRPHGRPTIRPRSLPSLPMAAMEWVMSGTHKGDFPKMPATTKPFSSVRGATIVELQGGKIRRCSDYWDAATFMRQVGLLAAPIKPCPLFLLFVFLCIHLWRDNQKPISSATAGRWDDQLEFMKQIVDVAKARSRPPEAGSCAPSR